MDEKTQMTVDNSALASALAEREQLLTESLAREQSLLEQSFSDQAERTQTWSRRSRTCGEARRAINSRVTRACRARWPACWAARSGTRPR